MNDEEVLQRLRELNLTLPVPPPPAANYRPWVRTGDLVFISGQLPVEGDVVMFRGRVGQDMDIRSGYLAARLCTLNGLAWLREALGSFDELDSMVRVEGHVRCSRDFPNQSAVIDGASDLLCEVLGDAGQHARLAVGHTELPKGCAVEVAFIAQAKPKY